jgi:hypothetical protein
MHGGEVGIRRGTNPVIDGTDPLPGRSFETMLPSERRLVQEVIDRLALMQQAEPDSLDWTELILDLEEGFGKEAARWGYRFYEALKIAHERRRAAEARGPLWDRDLDGGVESTDLPK